MSFHSLYADRIWEDLYDAMVPDFITMDREFIRKFGVPSSGNKDVDKMMSSNTTFVKIPIIRMLEYFENGIEVQIPSRKDMIAIHKAIENYLGEWKEHIRYEINIDRTKHKDLLLSLERMSKLIYAKAYPREVIDTILIDKNIGLASPMDILRQPAQDITKPDYNGIGSLLRPSRGGSRY